MSEFKTTLLFFSANPKGSTGLNLIKEFKEIRASIQRGESSKNINIIHEVSTTFEDMRRIIFDTKPNVVHFSGHGSQEGIFLEDSEGISYPVSGEILKETFSLFGHINCVILNSCFSESQARAISTVVPYTIGISGQIKDDLAIDFSVAFYDALSAKRNVKDAFSFGVNAVNSRLKIDVRGEIVDYRSIDLSQGDSCKNRAVLIVNGNAESLGGKFKKYVSIKKTIYVAICILLLVLAMSYINNLSCEIKIDDATKKSSVFSSYFESNDGSVGYPAKMKVPENARKLKTGLPIYVKKLEAVDDRCLRVKYLHTKYHTLSYFHYLSSIYYAKDYIHGKNERYKNEAISESRKIISYGNQLLALLKESKENEININEVYHRLASAYSILEYFDVEGSTVNVQKFLGKISTIYIEDKAIGNEFFINQHMSNGYDQQ